MDDFIVRPFSTQEDFLEASHLLYKTYFPQGYVSTDKETYVESTKELLAQKTSNVFGIFSNFGKLIGTMSLFFGEKLPMESLYKSELDSLRKDGILLAEVGRFAVDAEFLQENKISAIDSLLIAKSLMKAVFSQSKDKNIDILCVTINPKHDGFYKAIGFETIGETKDLPSVNNAPAIAKIMHIKSLYNAILTEKIIPSSFLKEVMSL